MDDPYQKYNKINHDKERKRKVEPEPIPTPSYTSKMENRGSEDHMRTGWWVERFRDQAADASGVVAGGRIPTPIRYCVAVTDLEISIRRHLWDKIIRGEWPTIITW